MRRLLKRFFWLGCLAGTAAAVWLYNYVSTDEFLRAKIHALLEERCPEADVQLRAARRNSDGTMSLFGLRFTQRFAAADVDLDIPEVKLHLAKEGSALGVARVELHRPRAQVATDGEFWKDESAWLDELPPDLPPVRVHKGTVELVLKSQVEAPARTTVSATSGAQRASRVSSRSSDRAEVDQMVLRLRNVDLSVGSVADHSLRVAGTAGSDLFDRVDLAARLGATGKAWALSIDFQEVRFDRKLHEMIARYLPDAARDYLAASGRAAFGREGREGASVVRPAGGPPETALTSLKTGMFAGWALQGRGRVRLTLQRTASEQPSLREFAVKLENASLAGPLLPFPLHGIGALVVYRDGVAKLLEFRGRNGETEISARGRLPLPMVSSEASGAALFVKVEHLELDERLRGRLPATWRRQWDRYRPAGTVNVAFNLSGSRSYRFSDAVLRCVDASFRFDKFPYRLEHVTGSIEQQGEALAVDLSAPAGGDTVRLTGTITKPGPNAIVSLNIDAPSVQLDDRKLLRALSPEARKLLGDLHARGPAEVHWRVRRDDPLEPYEQSARVVLDGVSVQWKGYPIDRVQGTLELVDGTWRTTKLRGRNDDGFIGASGTLGPRELGFPLALRLRGESVELERELRDTLAPRWRELWQQMAVDGRCDFVADLTGTGRNLQLKQLQLVPRDVAFRPVGFDVRFTGLHSRQRSSIRILPYAVDDKPDEKLRASARPGWKVEFQGLQANHGPSRWQSDGSLHIEPSGARRLTLQHLAVDHLAFDEPLLNALPEGLARACRQLNPTGPSFQLRNAGTEPALVLEWSDVIQTSRHARWDLALRCNEASFDIAGGLYRVTGAVTFGGVYRDERVQCLGELALESCTWRDLQFTNLEGPLSITKSRAGTAPTHIVLGKADEEMAKQHRLTSTLASTNPRHLSAELLGGQIIGDIRAVIGRKSTYALRALLEDGRLEQYAAQVLPGRKRVRGRLTAGWFIKSAEKPGQVDGWGYLKVDDGDLYEVPLVLNLLPVAWNLLNLNPPESPSVHSGIVELRLLRGRVAVQHMELVSDTITFRGKGAMQYLSADSPVELVFSTMGTKNRSRVPLLGNLIDRASKELVALHVHGSLREPEVRPRYIPNVDGALQEIGSIGDTQIRGAFEKLRRILDGQP